MKTTELRIGNFISRNDLGDDSERIEIIIELGKMALTTGPINVMCEYDEIKPIPLTEEWLIRFGASKSLSAVNNTDIFHIKINDNNLLVIDCLGEVLWSKGGDIGGLELNIKYVHQLQNLYFALTGEELTIL